MTEQQEPENSQAQDQIGSGWLKSDELINVLTRQDPTTPPDLIVLVGFLGESPRKGYWRLYLTLDLNEHLEFSEKDAIHSQSLKTDQNPLGGTIVWIKRDAKLHHTRATSTRTQAEFLKGEVTQRFLPEIGIGGAIQGLGNAARVLVLAAVPSFPTSFLTICPED